MDMAYLPGSSTESQFRRGLCLPPRTQHYLRRVSARMPDYGFAPHDLSSGSIQALAVFRRVEWSWSKLSLVDTFCILMHAPATMTPAQIEAISAQTFTYGLRHKTALPRILGSFVIVYPVLIMDCVPDDLREFMQRGYLPKHYIAFEFPVIVELITRRLYHTTATPLWGSAFYCGFRQEVGELLG